MPRGVLVRGEFVPAPTRSSIGREQRRSSLLAAGPFWLHGARRVGVETREPFAEAAPALPYSRG